MTSEFFSWNFQNNQVAQIRYAKFGESSGKPPLLFIHGYGASIEHWTKNISTFSSDREVYVMDLLGFGESEKPNAGYGLALWAKQIFDFLALMSLEKVVLVGHSMGGAASLAFAHDHPDKVASLVLVDASGIFPDEVSAFEKILYQAVGSPFIGEALFGMFANEFGARQSLVPTYFNPSQVTDELVAEFAKPLRSKGAIFSYLAPSRNPDRFLLNRFPRPCHYHGGALLVWGEFDRAFPAQRTIPKFKELLPQAETVIIPKTAHCPHHEQAEAFNTAVKLFLEKKNLSD
jgi:pimeloyl-ACP methyl ester carboxylesterase